MSLSVNTAFSDHALGWIALNLVPGIGPARAHYLATAFGTPSGVFTVSQAELTSVPYIGEVLAKRLLQLDWRKRAQLELKNCQRVQCRIITLEETDYPELLRAIACPPPVLYVRGQIKPEDAQALAVVGCRLPTPQGLFACRRLAGDLVLAGFTIVSGLARGIDTEAHRTALETGGRTLAVLAHGLDRVYPEENRELLARISENGAAISEFPLGMTPLKENFPRRNRVISGLAKGVLVVEAGADSGALITAHWAVEQNREVFAVPGPYNAPLSQGTHALIQAGAKLTTNLTDILAELPSAHPALPGVAPTPPQLTPEQAGIRKALKDSAGCHVDQLAVVAGLAMEHLLAELVGLELRGLVRVMPGEVYYWVGN